MEYEFMTIDTPLPPSMPLPRAMLRLPISSTAKIMYARMLDDVLANGIEDMNGILFICFPIVELSAAFPLAPFRRFPIFPKEALELRCPRRRIGRL